MLRDREVRRFVVAAVAVAILLMAPGAIPVRASTGGLAGGVMSSLDTPVPSLLGPTGWLFDDTQTPVAEVAAVIGADKLYALGVTGRGVGVAIVDTGAVPVTGLGGNIVNGPDLSFDGQFDDARFLDTFGHGTHLAGIIAGNDPATLLGVDRFRGIAPDAMLTSVKVGSSDGAVDVSQVIAGIDWVVVHRNDDPANPIRVLNLSYGTDGTQGYLTDPLTHAVENAWRAGIVVVVAGGNSGTDAPRLNNPAYDPYVLAVGASDTRSTVTDADDLVPDFSSRGDPARRVDLVAPGRSIVSLRDPGSYIDEAHPGARVGTRFFKGSGSSQSAAVASGAVALLLQNRPDLSPDQVKGMLQDSAQPMPNADSAGRGSGELDVFAASLRSAPNTPQTWQRSTGLGSLEQARGTQHVADGDMELTGERHVLGPFHAAKWAPASAAFAGWTGGQWAGAVWSGDCWCATSWTGASWAGRSWAGRSWAGESWAGRSWAGRSWADDAWTGRSWAGRSWAGDNWTGLSWSATGWGTDR
jgi:serine protease AprX